MTDRTTRAEVGSSFIEVLAAMAILGGTLVAVAPMLVLSVHATLARLWGDDACPT